MKGGQEEAATAQTSQDAAAIKGTPMPADTATGRGDTNPWSNPACLCIPTGIARGVSLFPSHAPPPGFAPQPTSVTVPSTSSAPAAASMPKASGSGIVLPISIPLQGLPGRRPDFLTDPIQGGSMDVDKESETMVDENLRKMARTFPKSISLGASVSMTMISMRKRKGRTATAPYLKT